MNVLRTATLVALLSACSSSSDPDATSHDASVDALGDAPSTEAGSDALEADAMQPDAAPDSAPSPCGAPCDDGDPCNGVETCNPVTAQCEAETFPACPVAPPECGQSGGVPGPEAGKITAAGAGGFRLYDEAEWTASEPAIAGLAAHPSVKSVTLGDVLANLNRTGTQVNAIAGTECFHKGFRWNTGDDAVTYWYPQGISGSGDASASGKVQGREVGLVSWYHKPENDPGATENKGVRVAIYDATNLNAVAYRLALLVKPVMDGATPSFEPVPIHAGGIVWYGDYLYVADTSRGLRVFDMSRILEVRTGNGEWFGKVSEAEGYHAYNYRYVIPQVTRYRLCASSCCARFSFVSLDRTTSPHSLLTGEYSASNTTGRLTRWPLDEATGKLELTGGRVQASESVFTAVGNMQGGASVSGQYFVSSSGSYLGLHTGKLDQTSAKRGWPYGPEDLYYSQATDDLWSATEHPGTRFVFAVKRAQVQNGCN